MGFVPLAVKSMYSLLEAPVRPAELVAVAKERATRRSALLMRGSCTGRSTSFAGPTKPGYTR